MRVRVSPYRPIIMPDDTPFYRRAGSKSFLLSSEEQTLLVKRETIREFHRSEDWRQEMVIILIIRSFKFIAGGRLDLGEVHILS